MSKVLQDFSDALAETVETVGASVVRVDARHRLPATGIVWNDDGLIVTAHHVVERDEEIRIGLPDGSTVEASLVGRDPFNDLALLKTQGNLTPAAWAKASDIKVGHLVLALGRPHDDLHATLGVVSAMGEGHGMEHGPMHESMEEDDKPKRRGRGHGPGRGGRRHGRGGFGRRGFGPRMWGRVLAGGHIRTDVVMYPGFSGGPLVSAYGTVYGMNTSGFMRGLSLAVPVGSIEKSVSALLKHGKVPQGYLGVRVQTAHLPEDIAAQLESDTGALVVSVESDSPAHKGGLLVGDIIVAVADSGIAESDELPAALTGDLVGQEVAFTIVRGGELRELAITVGEQA